MERCCFVLTMIVCPLAAVAAARSIPPAPDLTTRVRIKASDSPVRMPAVRAFLSPRPDDRLNSRWPDKMTQQDCLIAVLNGKLDRFDGFWPFRYPAGDPDKVLLQSDKAVDVDRDLNE